MSTTRVDSCKPADISQPIDAFKSTHPHHSVPCLRGQPTAYKPANISKPTRISMPIYAYNPTNISEPANIVHRLLQARGCLQINRHLNRPPKINRHRTWSSRILSHNLQYVIDASSDFPRTNVITSTEPPVAVDASSDIYRDNVAADIQTTFRTPEMFPDRSNAAIVGDDPNVAVLEDSLLKNKSSDSLSPMGLDMLANHSDLSPHSGMQHRKLDEVSSILCTPQKLVFEDACQTPSKQPLLPRVIATTESPFKRGVHALAQLALMITPPKSPRKEETSQTPPSRCSTKSLRTRPFDPDEVSS